MNTFLKTSKLYLSKTIDKIPLCKTELDNKDGLENDCV